mmetsp:Transcript_3702/g.10502  ORF Transcript_3702/g.10502 Transcript_3702/m.10502 type:complete len:213 (-) Transcript_3702:1251-1889(-)
MLRVNTSVLASSRQFRVPQAHDQMLGLARFLLSNVLSMGYRPTQSSLSGTQLNNETAMSAEVWKQGSDTVSSLTHLVGLAVGDSMGAGVALFVDASVGLSVTTGCGVGASVGELVGDPVGARVGCEVLTHSVQHSHPWASQSRLRTSRFRNRQTSFGSVPFRLLFPIAKTSRFLRLARPSGTHPVSLLSFSVNFVREFKFPISHGISPEKSL